MWRYREEMAIYKPRREVREEIDPTDILDLGLLASWTARNKLLLFKSPSLWYFVMAAWANSYTFPAAFEREMPCYLSCPEERAVEKQPENFCKRMKTEVNIWQDFSSDMQAKWPSASVTWSTARKQQMFLDQCHRIKSPATTHPLTVSITHAWTPTAKLTLAGE